ASRIQRMLGHFQNLLDGILANPDRPLAELSLLSGAEQHQLLVEWNQTETPLPADCFHHCFEAQVEKTPDAIAVVDAEQTLTYQQLDYRANQLAHVLPSQGVEPEALVGVYLPRSVELMIALLGVLKAGGAYIPLDPQLPEERLRFILDDAQVSLLLTASHEALPESLASACPTLNIQAWDAIAQAPSHPPAIALDPDNLAYVIYTSGSTGMPKGALLTHRGLVNYLNWCTQAYAVAAGNGAPVQSSIGFDATITSLFAPLLTGRPVTLLPETHDIEALNEALTAESGDRFSLIKLTPSHLKALVPLLQKRDMSASLPVTSPRPSPPHAFILGGEALHSHDLTFWQQHFPNTRFINEYGPTEAVVGCCIYDVPLDFDGDAIPIGRPIANVQLYVLDSALNPVPVGVPGELYISGAGVARGYLNRPDLTAERFVPNPFCQGIGNRIQNSKFKIQDSQPDVRARNLGQELLGHTAVTNQMPRPDDPLSTILYKTGDRACYRPDGTLEYLGRMDDQIKLRGYRIEPGEIEAVLCQHPDVKQAVVVLRDDLSEAAKLVAYVVPEAGARRHEGTGNKGESGVRSQESGVRRQLKTQNSKLKTYLSQHLPPYMIPDYFVRLDTVPLTVNGKVNRSALSVPEVQVVASGDDSEPQTEVEERLAAVWATVLRRERVGIHDNFFELGGDSILGMQIIAKAHQVGLHLKPRQLFQYQTVAELATVAEVRSHTPISQDAVTGSVPLTPIQRDFFDQDLPEQHHFNQAIMVEVAADVQPQFLERALRQLVVHHDGLRSCFFQQDGKWQQVIQAPDAITVPLDEIDLSGVASDIQATALERATNKLQASLNLAAGPLFRAALLRLGGKDDRLLLIAHHLVVDGVSWRILLEDLATAYHQIADDCERDGDTLLPPKTQSFQSWAHQLSSLAQAGVFDAERPYWQQACAVEAFSLPMDFEGDVAANAVASVDEIVTTLDAEQTQKLLEGVSQHYNAQVNEVLLAALGQTLKAWTHSSTVLIDLEGHGRQLSVQHLPMLADGVVAREMDVSRTVGWFTAVYPLKLMIPAGAIADQLKAIKEQLRSVPSQGIGYGILRNLASSSDPALVSPAQISFNYLGQINLLSTPDAASVKRDVSRYDTSASSLAPHPPIPTFPRPSVTPLFHSLVTEPTGQLHSPLGRRRHLLEMIALVREGQLQVIWRYSRQIHRCNTIKAIAQRYLATLRSYITDGHQPTVEEKTYSPSDFAAARVNQAQLDQLLNKIQGG
ncbi:MAG: amino acid adenylation domain-containing protein, partial [Cyanobacteria bacterium P01_F01_bin.86]